MPLMICKLAATCRCVFSSDPMASQSLSNQLPSLQLAHVGGVLDELIRLVLLDRVYRRHLLLVKVYSVEFVRLG